MSDHQYQVSTDKRSGIVNDPNREDDPQYILRLVGQVITVSLETQRIIGALPSLNLAWLNRIRGTARRREREHHPELRVFARTGSLHPTLRKDAKDGAPGTRQRRDYVFNVHSEEKRVEKIRSIFLGPVRRGLVLRPENCRWSSFNHYATGEPGLIEIESEGQPAAANVTLDYECFLEQAAYIPPFAKTRRMGHPGQ